MTDTNPTTLRTIERHIRRGGLPPMNVRAVVRDGCVEAMRCTDPHSGEGVSFSLARTTWKMLVREMQQAADAEAS